MTEEELRKLEIAGVITRPTPEVRDLKKEIANLERRLEELGVEL